MDKGAETSKANAKVNAYDTECDFDVQSDSTGRHLFDQVVNLLEIKAIWFFGLQYKDSKGVDTWLKLSNKIFSQDVGKQRPILFKFRAKFFPEDIVRELLDHASLKLFYFQVKRLILNEDIYCPSDKAVLLASYATQVKLGDYTAGVHNQGFLEDQNVLPQTVLKQYELSFQEWENRIVSFYKDHKGISKNQAMTQYLHVTQNLEMFGVVYFDIKNKKGTKLLLGVDPLGLNVYETENRLSPKLGFPWSEVKSISFANKKFIIKSRDASSPNFTFYASRARLNKEILSLSMGNHELFIRRRHSTSVQEPPNLLKPEYPLSQISYEPFGDEASTTVKEAVPSTSGLNDVSVDDHQEPQANAINTTETEALLNYNSPEPPETVVNGVLDITDDDRERDYDLIREEQIANGEASMEFKDDPNINKDDDVTGGTSPEDDFHYEPSTDEADYSLVNKTYHSALPNLQEETVEETIPSAFEETTQTAGARAFEDDAMSHDAFEKNVALNDYVHREPLREADIPRKAKSYGTDLHWEMGQETTAHDRRQTKLEEEAHLFMGEKYEKLRHLFQELSSKQKVLSVEDSLHRQMLEEGMDKYKTLTNIQKGLTKTRVSIFETM